MFFNQKIFLFRKINQTVWEAVSYYMKKSAEKQLKKCVSYF